MMKKRIPFLFLMVLVLSLLFSTCVLAQNGQGNGNDSTNGTGGGEGAILSTESLPDVAASAPVSDRVVIVYKDGGSDNIANLNLTTDQVAQATTLTDSVDVVRPESGQDKGALMDQIRQNDSVESVFQDISIPIQGSLPNDPSLTSYLYYNTGNDSAWNSINNSSAVRVAVIDSGSSPFHPDLAGRVESVKDLYGADKPAYAGNDLSGHGTEVSGTIAATANNGIGIAGITGTTNVSIVPYRCGGAYSGDKNLSASYVVAAMKDVANDDSIKVVNMSFGIQLNPNSSTYTSVKAAVEAMKEPVATLVSKGKILVAAAGNEGSSLYYDYPAAFDGVIAVGSVGSTNAHSTYSNVNDKVDVVAPGEALGLTGLNNAYSTGSGTSFSSPVVAGEAAMILAQNSNLTAAQVTSLIENNTVDLGSSGYDTQFGYGLVQIDKALVVNDLKLTASADVSEGSLTLGKTVNFTASAANGSEPYAYVYTATKDGTVTASGNSSTFAWTPAESGTYTVTVTASDSVGATDTRSFTYTVIGPVSVASFTSDAASGQPLGTTVNLTAAGRDGVTPYQYKFTVTLDGTETTLKDYSQTNTTAWTPGKTGAYTLKVYLKDNGGTVVTQILDYKITTGITYQTHVQDVGWQNYVANGALSGTEGQSKRLEAIQIKLNGSEYSGSIQYQTHIQDYGWQGWRYDGAMSGTQGESKRLEAIQISLSGDIANYYDVYYRVHAQNFGWMGWAKNGEKAGTSGYAYRLEGIQIVLVAKGGAAPGSTDNAYRHPMVQYQTHVQDYGWQELVNDGATSGTVGESKRLEAIKVYLNNADYEGGIQYITHVQDYGWQDWRSNGALSGTQGESKRLEAIQIKLTGEMADHYDVYYRVHCQNFGWLGWAENGGSAGSAGYSYRLEGIQIVLVAKGGAAPGSTDNAFYQK